jgi:hypothetical protein
VNRLRYDDILSARELSAKDKLSQALEAMAYGLELQREKLRRINPDALDNDVEKAFEDWLFASD